MMGCGIAHFGRRVPPKLTTSARVETPSGAASPNPREQKFRPNFVSLGGFPTPPTKMSYIYHTPSYTKIWDLSKEKNVNYPFKMNHPPQPWSPQCHGVEPTCGIAVQQWSKLREGLKKTQKSLIFCQTFLDPTLGRVKNQNCPKTFQDSWIPM